jgi:hypothetical protein
VVNLDFTTGSLIGFLGALFLVLFLIIQVAMVSRRRLASENWSLRLVLWLAFGPPLLMWLVSQVQAVYLERALLPSALMLYLALGWLFARGRMPRPIAVLVGVVGLALVAIGLFHQYTWDTFPNSPFRPAGEYIRDHWQEGDVVVHQNKLTALPMIYYERDVTQHYISDAPGSPQDTLALPTQESLGLLADACVQMASAGGSRVWWVTFDFAREQYAAADRPDFAQAKSWLDQHYSQVETVGFNDLEIVLYTDPDLPAADCEDI